MGLVTLPSYGADPVTVNSSNLNGKVDPLATEFNGNIENANIKSGAAIAASKLNLATIAQVMAMSSKELLFAKGADVASGTSITLGTDGNYFDITGTTTIQTITAKQAGSVVRLHFDGALTLTDDTGNLELQGRDLSVKAEDEVTLVSDGTNWLLGSVTSRNTIVEFPITTLTDAATIATDASLGTHFRVTLGGNRTLGEPTNPTDGQKCTWEVIQDGTGSRTLSFNAVFAFGTDVPSPTLTTTANKRDFITAVYNSTADKWYVLAVSKGY